VSHPLQAYEHLWGDVTKQLLTHTSQTVLVPAAAAIQKFVSVTSLSNTNNAKVLELEEELSTSLRDVIGGREDVDTLALTEDEQLALGHICTRFAVLAKVRNLVPCLEEDEGGKQSSAYNILTALVDRGKLGYREEETVSLPRMRVAPTYVYDQMVSEALNLLTMHIIWKAKSIPSRGSRMPDDKKVALDLLEQRTALVQKLVEFPVGTQSNTAESVKRVVSFTLNSLCPRLLIACISRPF
jgi:cohesin complex subunit SA-1/2